MEKEHNSLCKTFVDTPAEGIRKMLKVPGLYRIVPRLWNTFAPKLFREDAGFRYHFYEVNKDEVKFDMTSCPYHQLCKELDCLEIASTFCDTDDICYGNMRPKLIWKRTKTIVRGDDVCDFNLYI